MNTSMIIKGDWKKFLTLRNEELLLVKRRHPFVIFFPILFTAIACMFFISGAYVLFNFLLFSPSLFFISMLIILSITTSIVTKMLIDWYFHMYILTNRRILELRYTPLTSFVTNDIMLDRVSCTEIDLQSNGFINELMDIGDVLITFDRPTHQEVFTLKDIQGHHELARYLTQQLMDGHEHIQMHPIWFRDRKIAIAK